MTAAGADQQQGSPHEDEDVRPRVWVICPQLGAASETWLWRQIIGMQSLRCSVITAQHRNEAEFPIPDGTTVLEDPQVRPQETGARRWARRLLRVLSRNFFALDRKVVKKFAELADSEAPDVILCHFGHIAVRFMPLAQYLGVPLVAHFHGLDLSSSLRNRWYRWSLARVLNEFSAAIVVGSHQEALVASMGFPDDRLHRIPCGVPVDDFPLAPPHESEGSTRFITVCRLVPWKGVDFSIRALAMLLDDGVDAELLVIGDGPQRDELESLARQLGLSGHVDFRGSLSQAEVHRSMCEADVFLQHSLERGGSIEGFGVSITEAAATGLPVVVSACGGIKDQVSDGHSGFLVPQGDLQTMAERMRQLALDPSLRRSLGLAGRERAHKVFNTSNQVRSLEQVLLDAAGDLPPTRRRRLA